MNKKMSRAEAEAFADEMLDRAKKRGLELRDRHIAEGKTTLEEWQAAQDSVPDIDHLLKEALVHQLLKEFG